MPQQCFRAKDVRYIEKKLPNNDSFLKTASSYKLYNSWCLKKSFFVPTFFPYNRHLLRQNVVETCLYMPQDGHWLASFEVIPLPSKVSFFAARKIKIPHWKLLRFWSKILVFSVFTAKILSRRSRLSRTSRAPSGLIRPRPIDCDRESEQTVKSFPVWGFEHRQKKYF